MSESDVKSELPDGAASLIALARVAHYEGNRQLERSAADKLVQDYGIAIRFNCVESVDRELHRTEGGRHDA